jgi:hypothetical protein
MPAKRKGSPKKGSPKRVLRLPDLDHAKRTVLDSLGSQHRPDRPADAIGADTAFCPTSPDGI